MHPHLEHPMFRRIANLPIRIIKRAMTTLSGERDAPSPAPPMAPVTRPEPATDPPKPAAQAKAPKKAKKKVAPKKSSVQVDAQETPNPNAMKFSLSITVAETGSFSFDNTDTNIAHPIAKAVIALDGVVSVFGVKDFITVSKDPQADWAIVMPAVVDAIKSAA